MHFTLKPKTFHRIKSILFVLLCLSLCVTSYIYYEFTYRGMVEEPAEYPHTYTSTTGLWSLKGFRSNLKQYKQLYKASMGGLKKETEYGTYVVPGLKSTRSLTGNHANGLSNCTSMTPQGIAVSDEYLFVSAYCHTKAHNSVIYVISKDTHKFIKEIVLPGRPHVGSLAYDEENENLWICGNGSGLAQANAISLDSIKSYTLDEDHCAPITYLFQNNVLEISRSSFMTCHNSMIYIGFFNTSNSGVLKKYQIEEDGNLQRSMFRLNGMVLESGLAIDSTVVPKKSQGMSYYYDKMFMSQSLGILPSRLVVFDDSLGKSTYENEAAILSFRLPSMLEQIYIYDDELYMLFESAAYAYRDMPATFPMDRIIKVDVSELKQLVNKSLQKEREAQKRELLLKKEARKLEHWQELSSLPWISDRIQFYTPISLPDHKWHLFHQKLIH